MRSEITLILLLLVTFLSALFLSEGCGADVTVREQTFGVDPAPSDANSVGLLSGFGYATAGDHYKAVHSLGRSAAENIQSSTNGVYQVKSIR